jgi:hypothetical protein
MFEHDYMLSMPVFWLFVAFTCLLSLGYFWGRRKNKQLFLSVFNELMEIVKPDDQTFTNIGGTIGYHANLIVKKKGPISQVDATITFLPRQSWLYLPISKFLIMKHDRLFITVYLKDKLPGEGHLIEKKHAGFRAPKITNVDRLNREDVRWGSHNFHLYYENLKVRDHFRKFMDENPDAGLIRHIAIVPDEKKGFIFVIPRKKMVSRYVEPVYRWFPRILAG